MIFQVSTVGSDNTKPALWWRRLRLSSQSFPPPSPIVLQERPLLDRSRTQQSQPSWKWGQQELWKDEKKDWGFLERGVPPQGSSELPLFKHKLKIRWFHSMRFSRLPLWEALNCPYLNTSSKQDGSIPWDFLSFYISHFLSFNFCLLPHLTD